MPRDELTKAPAVAGTPVRAGSQHGFDQLEADLQPFVSELEAATSDVVDDAQFRAALSSIAAVDATVQGPRIPGTIVVELYLGTRATFAARPVCYDFVSQLTRTTATTDITDGCGERPGTFAITRLRPILVDRVKQLPEGLACDINTLAHEWAHSITSGTRMVFLDGGYQGATFPLVSYTVGAVAQCVYLRRWRPQLDLSECIEAVGTHAFDACTCAPGWLDAFIAGDTTCGRARR